jgi:putative hemolysin
MLVELGIIVLLVVANGLFAGAEIAVLSAQKARVLEGARRRDPRALAVQALRANPERFLATVQVGITVVGSAAAAFGGARLAADLAPVLDRAGLGYADEVAFALVVAAISYLTLVLGELVPKSLALRYADGYAFAVARPLTRLASLARPMVWLLTRSSNVVLAVFGDRTSFAEARLSRDELRELVDEAARSGSLDAPSGAIAARALDFGDVTVAEVMVPRSRIVALPRDASPAEVKRVLLEEGHSRMPVHDGDLDRVTGYVVARDVLALQWEQGLVVLADIIRPVLTVPEAMRLTDVLRQMQVGRVQLAVVIDEHGSVSGLVTIEDVLEELVGDILDEHDTPDELVQLEPNGDALVPGWAPLRKVNRALDLALPVGRDSTTIAGLCVAMALMVPPRGARLTAADGTVLEIVDASPRRVRTVRVVRGAAVRPRAPDEADDRR